MVKELQLRITLDEDKQADILIKKSASQLGISTHEIS